MKSEERSAERVYVSQPVRAVVPIPLAYAPRDLQERPVVTSIAKWGTVCCCVVLWIGWALIVFVDVETVLIVDPVLAVLALVTGGCAIASRWWAVFYLSLAHIAVCSTFVALVNLLRWSPSDAHKPFLLMSLIWACMSTVWTTIEFCKQRS